MMNLYNLFVAATAMACAEPAADAGPVVLINVFEAPAHRIEEALDAWDAAHDFLQHEPGYISTALHQAIQSGARFQLVNLAHWESPESFQRATARMREAGVMPPVEGLSFTPALYQVVRSDRAEFCDAGE